MLFHITYSNTQTKRSGYMTRFPMSESECMVMLSKLSVHKYIHYTIKEA